MEELIEELKAQIKEALNLEELTMEEFDSDAALFGDAGIGLDSIDALELGVALKKKFGIKFSAESGENKKHFASVDALAEYITKMRG